MKVELPLGTPITFFVRVKGPGGERELQAVLDTAATYTVIPLHDALQLGYAVEYDPTLAFGQNLWAVTIGVIIEAALITLLEIRIGDLVAKNVEALAYNLPKPSRLGAVLGLSFLKNFKTTIDYKKGVLTIEEP